MAGCSVAVVGAGKMGLPLACRLAANGATVTACDINSETVAAINAGRLPFNEPGVEPLLRSALSARRMSATTNLAEGIGRAEVVVVIVPVMLTAEHAADLAAIDTVTRCAAKAMQRGALVSYETTVPVGTTRNRFAPMLEDSGMRAGTDFDVVFSPERVKSHHVLEHLTKIPKIVGGICPRSAARGEQFYGAFLGAPVINVGTLEAAELAKLAGMLYRDVNIALANELAAYAESVGVDFSVVRPAANTDGEAFLLQPGIGVGGHCTPVYPHFVLRDAEERGVAVELAAAARSINSTQARRLLSRLEGLGIKAAGSEILILGLGFRPEVKAHAYSPAFAIRDEAIARGASVRLHDPLYTAEEIAGLGFAAGNPDDARLPEVVILSTAHHAYASPDFAGWRRRGAVAVIDGRNFWNRHDAEAAGLKYIAPGIPSR